MNKQWNPNLETGNEIIDDHHKELFKIYSMLDDAIQSNTDNEVEKIVVFLEGYVLDNFIEEEKIMQEHKFSGINHHQTEHNFFRASVSNIRNDFNNSVFKAHLMFRIRQFVDKLIIHVLTVDIHIESLEHGHD